jgi:hypothetical protein
MKFFSRLLIFAAMGATIGGLGGGTVGLLFMWLGHQPGKVAVFVTVAFAIVGVFSCVYQGWYVIEGGSRVRIST